MNNPKHYFKSFAGDYKDRNMKPCNCKECSQAARHGFFVHIANAPDTPAHIRDMVREYVKD